MILFSRYPAVFFLRGSRYLGFTMNNVVFRWFFKMCGDDENPVKMQFWSKKSYQVTFFLNILQDPTSKPLRNFSQPNQTSHKCQSGEEFPSPQEMKAFVDVFAQEI